MAIAHRGRDALPPGAGPGPGLGVLGAVLGGLLLHHRDL